MRRIASFCFAVMVVVLAAVYLPMLYEKIFFKRIEKTHLFYSLVTRQFIFKEKVVGEIPKAVGEKSEDHHAEISYQWEDGTYVTRVEFERHLPFIFYKNMEIRGLLPLALGGKTFDKKAIKAGRRVMELKSREIAGNRPNTPVWPLLESNPGQARLVFPDDRFHMTPSAMEFINADSNRVAPDLTRAFTTALRDEGFQFPARSVNGKFTVLKPFDEGIFVVDDAFQVFHVKRRDGRPVVKKTPIDPGLKTRYIDLSENRRREFYGLLLDGSGRVHLLSYDDYRLFPLPLEGYDPDRMDLKLIFNPLYCTAVWSDKSKIHALAMDRYLTPIRSFSHTMSRATVTPARQAYRLLFPFTLHLDTSQSGFLTLKWQAGGMAGIAGLVLCLGCWLAWRLVVRRQRPGKINSLLVACSGIFGLIAVSLTDLEN